MPSLGQEIITLRKIVRKRDLARIVNYNVRTMPEAKLGTDMLQGL